MGGETAEKARLNASFQRLRQLIIERMGKILNEGLIYLTSSLLLSRFFFFKIDFFFYKTDQRKLAETEITQNASAKAISVKLKSYGFTSSWYKALKHWRLLI